MNKYLSDKNLARCIILLNIINEGIASVSTIGYINLVIEITLQVFMINEVFIL